MPLTGAAQRVQISAYPDAYAKHEDIAEPDRQRTGRRCRPDGPDRRARGLRLRPPPGQIAASGWTAPIARRRRLRVPHRQPATPQRRGHRRAASEPRSTPRPPVGCWLPAATRTTTASQTATWTVFRARADAAGSSTSCTPADTSPATATWSSKPRVVPGQLVEGRRGDRRRSAAAATPPVRTCTSRCTSTATAVSRGAVNPVPFMRQRGAPLNGRGMRLPRR